MKLSTLYKVNSVILLTGESGTGKSKLAREIHQNSERKEKPFLQVNVCAIAENLFESELFGHFRGAFTGAHSDKNGYLDTVGEGTLFLDEIGDLSLSLQTKLLMLLEERIYYPVGSNKPKKFSGTIILATHKNLQEEVDCLRFRTDLYFRIRLFHYDLQPLRLEKDVETIIKEIWIQICEENQMMKTLSQSAIECLLDYAWPGNYRELKNTLEFAYFNCEEEMSKQNLPIWVRKPVSYDSTDVTNEETQTEDFYTNLEAFERNFLLKAFNRYQGRVNLTAQRINLNKVTLISKIKKYDINTLEIKYFASCNRAI